jgi:Uma2 family endonuclease
VSGAATHWPEGRLSIEQYLALAETDIGGRHELVDGRVVAMSPERVRHNRAKKTICRALEEAVEKAGLPCEVFTDGVGVRTGEATVREPDASVQCGVSADPDAMILERPLIVVEVVSPGSGLMDTGRKLVEYFGLDSVCHYLIVDPELGAVVHHARVGDGVSTSIHRSGSIRLDPPGLDLTLDAVIAAGLARSENAADREPR